MCFATGASLVLAGIGTAVQTASALQAGNAAAAERNYQAAVAHNNEIIAKQNEEYALKAGEAKAQAESERQAALQGRVRAAIAANNLDVNSGTPLDVQVSQREQGKLDTETVIHNANLEAYGYRVQQQNFATQAQLDQAAAEQSQRAGEVAALGTLLSGASGVAKDWAKLNPPTPTAPGP